jgi:putative flippase GtrA
MASSAGDIRKEAGSGSVTRRKNGAWRGTWRKTGMRWLKFNAVGGIGIAVQLVVLLGLKDGFHLNYLLATALAVEAAVVHNFIWHERYTWADRSQPSWRKSLPRFMRFNLTTGAVSIVGNLALMRIMIGLGHLNYLVANGIAIALCSVVNFVLSDRVVFAPSPHRHVPEIIWRSGNTKNEEGTQAHDSGTRPIKGVRDELAIGEG